LLASVPLRAMGTFGSCGAGLSPAFFPLSVNFARPPADQAGGIGYVLDGVNAAWG
jgi:hypothetical protein